MVCNGEFNSFSFSFQWSHQNRKQGGVTHLACVNALVSAGGLVYCNTWNGYFCDFNGLFVIQLLCQISFGQTMIIYLLHEVYCTRPLFFAPVIGMWPFGSLIFQKGIITGFYRQYLKVISNISNYILNRG